MPSKPKKEERRFVIEDIPTQTVPVIKDVQSEKRYDLLSAVAKVLENQEELLKLAAE